MLSWNVASSSVTFYPYINGYFCVYIAFSCSFLGCNLPSVISCFLDQGFPSGPAVKNAPANAGDARDVASVPGSGRCPGGGHGNPLQYSCLENPMGRGALWAPAHREAKSWTRLKWPSTHMHEYTTFCLSIHSSSVWVVSTYCKGCCFEHCGTHICLSPCFLF